MLNETNCYKYALQALSESYISLYIFDLQEDTLYPLKTNQYTEICPENFEGNQNKLHNIMSNITSKNYLKLIEEFTDFSILEARMKEHKVISAVFQGKMNGWCKARFTAIDDNEEQRLRYVLYSVECIEEKRKKENHLLYMARTDLMTGIFNRGYGEKMISKLLEEHRTGMFFLFDVDKFKQVNDKYGHIVGDQVLVAVASALQKVKRRYDIIMRLGGDEFAGYFVDIMSKEDATDIIKSVFNEISKIHIEPMTEKISVSLGAVLYADGFTFDSIYKIADKCVYDSKLSKGSSYTFPG